MPFFLRASELLLSIPLSKRKSLQPHHPMSAFSTSTPARSQSPQLGAFASQSPISSQVATQPVPPMTPANPHFSNLTHLFEENKALESRLEAEEDDEIRSARSAFEKRDFIHAIRVLKGCRSSKAKFISVYCKFIVSCRDSLYHRRLTSGERQARRRPKETGTNWTVRSSHFLRGSIYQRCR